MCFISSILFSSFTSGRVVGFVGSLLVLLIVWVKEKSLFKITQFYIVTKNNYGISIFLFLYALIFLTNYGIFYTGWDEFSHWGIFVKEILRLDRLYCTSTAPMAHRDYVPAISIFEAIYCKLSMRFSEADTYRGIQLLQASMMLPLLNVEKKNTSFLPIAQRFVIVFGTPLLFGNFYNTIYQDLIYGIIVFYCMYVILKKDDERYKCFVLTISLSVLILSKMTALAFLPMVVVFYFVYEYKFSETSHKRLAIYTTISTFIPLALWAWYEQFQKRYAPDVIVGQSYSGLKFKRIIGTLLRNGTVTYQKDVDVLFLKSLFFEGVVQRIPYVVFVVLMIISLWWLKKQQKGDTGKKVSLVILWVALASIAYAAMTHLLYLNLFSEYEATRLASYSRYMGTMLIAIVYIVLAMYYLYFEEKSDRYNLLLAVLLLENIVMFLGVEQLQPGVFRNDSAQFVSEAEAIERNVGDDESVYVVACWDSGMMGTVIRYRCSPRQIDCGSLGSPRYVGDVWSLNLDRDQCFELLSKYDYVYMLEIDDTFLEQYEDVFNNSGEILDHTLYKVRVVGSVLELEAL
jgi:hypothetical protein